MKTILIVLAVFLLAACEKYRAPEELEFQGKGTTFTQVQKNWGGLGSQETSLVNVAGEVYALHGISSTGEMRRSHLGPQGRQYLTADLVGSSGYSFAYVFEHAGTFYNLVNRDGETYLLKSTDLMTWSTINGGRPVLTKAPGTLYHHIWNVAGVIDDTGLFHLLIESSDPSGEAITQWNVGLAYATGRLVNDEINFDLTRTDHHVIPKGGNPDVKFLPGRGLMVLHGSLEGAWVTRATTYVNGVWTTHADFGVGTPTVHVCDPSLVELADGTTVLTVSYDQTSTTLTSSPLSIAGLFDYLTQ